MKKSIKGGVVGALAVLASSALAGQTDQSPLNKADAATARRDAISKMFLENDGQWDKRALFHTAKDGMSYWVRKDGVTLDIGVNSDQNGKTMRSGHAVRMDFVGASKSAKVSGVGKLPTRTDFIERGKPVISPDAFNRVTIEDVYPNVDVHHYFDQGKARYDVVIQPGAEPNDVRLSFKGADAIVVDKDGDLSIKTGMGTIRQGGLYAFQKIDGKEVKVPAAFELKGKNEVVFRVGNYDKSRPLVIDPLVYASYFGGDGGRDQVNDLVSEPDGGVFMTGWTESPNYPVLEGGYQVAVPGARNAFFARFRGDAYTIEYSTYLGGSARDEGLHVATDATGDNIWVLGKTASGDFPVFGGPVQPTRTTACDLFLFQFRRDANKIVVPVYGSYVAPTGSTFYVNANNSTLDPVGFEITSTGNLTWAGFTDGTFPKAQNAPSAGQVYVAQMYRTGRDFRWVRYSGANFSDVVGMAVNKQDQVFISGLCIPGFQTFGATFQNANLIRGDTDSYIAKFTPNGTPLCAGVIGGSDIELAGGIAIDLEGNAVVLGFTTSFDYPRTQGTYGQEMRDQVVITKVRGDGTSIVASTSIRSGAFGGLSGDGLLKGIAVDGRGNIVITGMVRTGVRFPVPAGNPNAPSGHVIPSIQVTTDAIKAAYSWSGNNPTDEISTYDAFINVFDASLSTLLFGSYVGAEQDDVIRAPYVDGLGDIWIYGSIDTSFGYRVNGTGAPPPTPKDVFSESGFAAGVLSPLAWKSQPERFWGGFAPGIPTPLGNIPYGSRESPFTAPATVPASAQTDGWVMRFRIGAPIITSLALSRSVAPGGLGTTVNGTVTLSGPAPAEGAEVTLTLENTLIAEFTGAANPSQIVIQIAGGATNGTFSLSTKPVTVGQSVGIRAIYAGDLETTSLTVVPWLSGISISPNALVGGYNTTLRVTLFEPAPASGAEVALSSSDTARFGVPATTTVPAGQQTVALVLPTSIVQTKGTAVVTASLLGVDRTASITTDPLNVTLNSLTVLPGTINSGGTATGTVTISVPAPDSGVRINLSTSDPAVAALGADFVTITPGAQSATFNIQGGTPINPTTATISASLFSTTLNANLTVNAPAFSVSLDPTLVSGGASSTATITLEDGVVAGPGGLVFTVGSSNTSAATVSATNVTIPAGASSATFTVNTSVVAVPTSVNISATLGSTTNVAVLEIEAAKLVTFTMSPTILRPFRNATGTVTIDTPAPAGGVVVQLTFNQSLFSTYPVSKTVTIPAGSTTAQFTMVAKSFSLPLFTTITATAGGVSKSVQVQIAR